MTFSKKLCATNVLQIPIRVYIKLKTTINNRLHLIKQKSMETIFCILDLEFLGKHGLSTNHEEKPEYRYFVLNLPLTEALNSVFSRHQDWVAHKSVSRNAGPIRRTN
jgi:hypothetical protein